MYQAYEINFPLVLHPLSSAKISFFALALNSFRFQRDGAGVKLIQNTLNHNNNLYKERK